MGFEGLLSSLHGRLIKLTGSLGGGTTDGSFLTLTHRGAKSGQVRETPLVFVNHEGGYVVAASNSGSPRNPAWYHNLLAHRQVSVNVGRREVPVTARLADDGERAELWPRFEAIHPRWARYQAKAGDRVIPLFVLTPR